MDVVVVAVVFAIPHLKSLCIIFSLRQDLLEAATYLQFFTSLLYHLRVRYILRRPYEVRVICVRPSICDLSLIAGKF